MHSLDQQVLSQLKMWLQQGREAWLCTVVATAGSSPRPVGSLFACADDGQTVGSLSGGCVEEDLIAQLLAGEIQHVRTLEYGVSAEENERLGLPCGGRLEVLIEPLDASWLTQLAELLAAVEERRYLTRCIERHSG
ncbi:MAG: XdhC family protein, partial [Pseudomonadota bacterium]